MTKAPKKTKEVPEKTKSIVVSIALRVPAKMRKGEIELYVRRAIMSERGHYAPEDNGHYIALNKDRIEIFMP